MDELMAENQRLESERSQLKDRIQQATLERAASATRETDLKNQLLNLKRDVARLEMKEIQFRDIIISNAATQQITDQDVIQAFSELRQTVQQLAKNQAFDLAQNPASPISDMNSQTNKHFYTVIRGLSMKDVSYRVRMRIWEILYKFVFRRAIFGLKSIRESEDKDHDYKADMWSIESKLALFEEYLSMNSKGLTSAATNVRPLTCS